MAAKKNILVIDDEESVRFVISEMLGNRGYSVTCIEKPGLMRSELEKKRFNLIITDLIMPGKMGADVIDDIKAINPEIPILAVSGGGRLELNDNLKLALNKGAAAVLSKPFSLSELVKKVDDLLTAI